MKVSQNEICILTKVSPLDVRNGFTLINEIEFWKDRKVFANIQVIISPFVIVVHETIWEEFFHTLVRLNFSIEDRLKLCHVWLNECTDTMCFNKVPFELCLLQTKTRFELYDMIRKSGYIVKN